MSNVQIEYISSATTKLSEILNYEIDSEKKIIAVNAYRDVIIQVLGFQQALDISAYTAQ